MFVDLHATLERLLHAEAPRGSLLQDVVIDFAVPDAQFRAAISHLTLSLYLHEVRENLSLRRAEPFVERSADGRRAAWRRAPAFIDCGYFITAWSPLPADQQPALEEHRVLADALAVLLRCQRIPRAHWVGAIAEQMPPYPTVVAQPDALKNQAEFWSALGHPPKPALSYVVTIAMPLHEPTDLGATVGPTDEAIELNVRMSG